MRLPQDFLDKMNDNTLYNSIGIRIELAENGTAKSRLQPRPEMCWPTPGQPHGGIIFTFMDTTMAWAGLSLVNSGNHCATINLDIQFTRPARGELFKCSAFTTMKKGRTIFMRAEIRNTEDEILALGQGTFREVKMDVNQQSS